MPGPLQVIAVGFGPGSDFEGRVLAEVDRLQGRGVLRLLDLLFVAKSEDGTIERLVLGDDEDFGVLLSSILPFQGAGLVEHRSAAARRGSIRLTQWRWPVPGAGHGACVLARRARLGATAVRRDRRGRWRLLGEGFLTSEVGLLVGAEVAAMEEAAG